MIRQRKACQCAVGELEWLGLNGNVKNKEEQNELDDCD